MTGHPVKENKAPLEFQVFSYSVDDGVQGLSDGDDDNADADSDKSKFTVHMFGKTQAGESVAVHVTGYSPSFCVLFDASVSTQTHFDDLVPLLQAHLKMWTRDPETDEFRIKKDLGPHLDLDASGLVSKIPFWGFQFGQKKTFFAFTTRTLQAQKKLQGLFRVCHYNPLSIAAMQDLYDRVCSERELDKKAFYANSLEFYEKECFSLGLVSRTTKTGEEIDPLVLRRDLQNQVRLVKWICKLGDKGLDFAFAQGKLYEVMDPVLRFAHLRDLKMAGWIRIASDALEPVSDPLTDCALEFHTQYDALENMECDLICSRLTEMSFDIESYSFDGKFPLPEIPQNYVYQIGMTFKNYTDVVYDRVLLHFRTPPECEPTGTGYCDPIAPIKLCAATGKIYEDCQCKWESSGDGAAARSAGGGVVGGAQPPHYEMQTHVENFETEAELLLRCRDLILQRDPDLIYGYNSDVFDWNYLFERARVVGCLDAFSRLSRFRDFSCRIEKATFSSAAYSDNEYARVAIPGRLNIDLLIWIQRNLPADRYMDLKLDTVAEKEIGENKRAVSAQDIFAAFKSGDSHDIAVIGDYCGQDVHLVQKLVDKFDVVTQMFEMANICDTPPSYLLHKGQQIKCFSQISKEAWRKDFLIPLANEREEGRFKGAVVLDVETGYYHTPIACLDFASLYPSIQIAFEICYTTLVLSEHLLRTLHDLRRRGAPLVVNGVTFECIPWTEDVIVDTHTNREYASIDDAKSAATPKKMIEADLLRGNKKSTTVATNSLPCVQGGGRGGSMPPRWTWKTKSYAYFYAQQQSCVIPALQVKLKRSRKMVKGLMAPLEHATDPADQLRYRILNSRQLSLKVSANSLYGFTSAFTLNLKPLGASVTAKGRQLIQQTRAFMETQFESIAKQRVWTRDDVSLYYSPQGKEGRWQTLTSLGDTNKKMEFKVRGDVLDTSTDGQVPSGYIRKYPVAVEGKPWVAADRSLRIHVVGGDTDSVFPNFPESSIAETISLCHKAADLLTTLVFNRAPIEMEYEKVYCPMIYLKKKNYVGLKFELDDTRWKIDYKGIATKRRNYCAFMKDVYWNVIHPALGLEKRDDGKLVRTVCDADLAVQRLRASCEPLIANAIPFEQLTISAGLRMVYKGKDCDHEGGIFESAQCPVCDGTNVIVNLPHVQLARRMKQRDAGSAPKPGQRFGYMIIENFCLGNDLSLKSEDPEYAKTHGLIPDALYYLNQQIRKPLTKFLTVIGQEAAANAVFTDLCNALFVQQKKRLQQLQNKTKDSFFDAAKDKKRLPGVVPLKPPKKQKKAAAALGQKPITSFFVQRGA